MTHNHGLPVLGICKLIMTVEATNLCGKVDVNVKS